jgi:glyoxylase-like metal-dependent hydrolase (beta-lactamase superfamily II)
MADKPAQPAPLSCINVGDIRVTYLPDGDGRVSPILFFPGSDDALWVAHQEFLDQDGKLVLSVGGFLIETGDQKVIVDLGIGDATVPLPPVNGVFQGGRFLDSLRQTGVGPTDVDVVFFTHLHFDHVGWTARDGSLTFPNARYLAGQGEWDFWRGVTDDDPAAAGGPDPEAVQAPLEHRIESVTDGQAVAPGVNVMASPGHTPGHCSVVISSHTERAIIFGDVIICPLQLDETELGVIGDVDAGLARQTRQRIAAELEAIPHTIAVGGHFSGSVFGRVVAGTAKHWVSLPAYGER